MIRHSFATMAMLMTGATSLFAQQRPDLSAYLMADRAAEIALARSAAPHQVSDSATVLVLTADGFTEAAHGSNGFVCAVFRSFAAGVDDPNFWNPHIRAPQCFNPPAARTVLPPMLRQADLAIRGTPPAQIPAAIGRASPANGSMVYMMSPRQYLDPSHEAHHWLPHLMLFYDHGESPGTWGAGDYSMPVVDLSASDPHANMLQLVIPVRRWSDGTAAR